MSPDLVALPCPRCAAQLRAGAPWCTQCFLEVEVEVEVEVQVEVEVPLDVPAPAQVAVEDGGSRQRRAGEADAGDPAGAARWPCSACGTRTPLTESACGGCGLGFLGGVAADAPVLELPLVGDLGRLSGAQRTVLALVVVLAVMLATALLGLVTR
ncbi:MAG TPA: hypothetical protein VFR07_00490 [Mycobacteriales bacterium]|nr:hypothetical protein [Mycobacteriales bacterium]